MTPTSAQSIYFICFGDTTDTVGKDPHTHPPGAPKRPPKKRPCFFESMIISGSFLFKVGICGKKHGARKEAKKPSPKVSLFCSAKQINWYGRPTQFFFPQRLSRSRTQGKSQHSNVLFFRWFSGRRNQEKSSQSDPSPRCFSLFRDLLACQKEMKMLKLPPWSLQEKWGTVVYVV